MEEIYLEFKVNNYKVSQGQEKFDKIKNMTETMFQN